MTVLNAAKGIHRLSQLDIDSDKDWALKGISNIAEVVAGMVKGDLVYYDGTQLTKITIGAVNEELVSQGPLHPPKWGYVA